ncbi:DUF6538 domain-containing protein [Ensifer sp. ZNC0028]|uniref:DUF6538 domain-containing protein n=1 Tax=Ensifer sp. ZNC0028 TaxID=1339236 RepID=UPI00068E4B15|nr:DUF6538 domain-containing protein [Ensifer sp. ZNC0028]
MALVMPSPVLISNTYYLRVRVPSDLPASAKGQSVTLPVGDSFKLVKMTDFVKVSLETREPRTAKERFAKAYSALQSTWQAMKDGPKPLSHKQSVALAGEIRAAFIEAFDDDPGNPENWHRVLEQNAAAKAARLNSLTIPTLKQQATDMEKRFGKLADARLAIHGMILAPQYRQRLLMQVAEGLDEMARVNQAKAEGDYSDSGETKRYPAFEAVQAEPKPTAATSSQTFKSVIDERVRRRSAGKDAVPLREETVDKYRLATDAFATFRKSDDLTTVTPEEADAWKLALMEGGELSNNTIGQRLQNVRTVIEWARKHSHGKLFPLGNPLATIERPSFQPVPSDARTYTMLEAKQVLSAARKETRNDLRWLPWMCAYSGARIEEVAQLSKSNFFKVGDDWFYRLTTSGGKTLKTRSSERRVPVHPELIKEGLMEFVNGLTLAEDNRIFSNRSQQRIGEWLRETVKITRPELAPSHGWRHLFEDVCLVGGVLDAAKNYITGRSSGKSGEGYGKSEAMLPGLANEMRKVPFFL